MNIILFFILDDATSVCKSPRRGAGDAGTGDEGPGGSMRAEARARPKRRGDFPQAREHVVVQPGDLRDDDLRIFAVLGQAFHHRTEERLWETGGTIEGFFDGELPRTLGAFHLRPELFEQQCPVSPGPCASRARDGGCGACGECLPTHILLTPGPAGKQLREPGWLTA